MSFLVLLFNADFLLLRHRHAWRAKVIRRAWLHMVVEAWNIFMSSLIFGGAVMGSTVLSFLETLLPPGSNRLAWLTWAL